MIVYSLLACIVLALIYRTWKTYTGTFAYWKKCGIPQPPGCVPFFGHLWPIVLQRTFIGDMHKSFYEMFKDYSMVAVNDAGNPVLLIREPELVKTVLQTSFSSFHENNFTVNSKVDPLLAPNPFFSVGEAWVTGRKNLTYAFSSSKLRILAETVNGVCKKFVNFLDAKIAESGTVELEMKDLFSRFTAEVVANAGFGMEGFCFQNDDRPMSFKKVGEKMFSPNSSNGISQALMFFFPVLSSFFQVSFVPKDIDQFIRQQVKQILAERRTATVRANDFLQSMVDRERTQGETIDDTVMAAHAFAFVLDGYETSSLTLTFAVYQLASHPDIQEKLRKEVLTVLSKHDNIITYEAIKEMTYMDQVLNESMRIHPVLTVMSKKCTKEIELKGSDGISCRVKPGTGIAIPVLALQNDPKYWIDPETFDPERFAPDKKGDLPKNCFLPFGDGPRICVGMRMGLLQSKAALAAFLRNYSFELSPRTQVPLKIDPKGFLPYPIGGIWVRIKRL